MITNPNILIYQNDNGNIKVNVKFEDETLWLPQTQSQICEVFDKVKLTIMKFIVIVNYFNTLSDSKEPNSYTSINTPLPPLNEVPTKGFSS